MNVTAVLFDGFETLDVFGPVEMLGASGEFQIEFYSLGGGIVKSYQGVPVDTQTLDHVDAPEVLLVPGGMGVYDMLENHSFIALPNCPIERATCYRCAMEHSFTRKLACSTVAAQRRTKRAWKGPRSCSLT